MELQKSSAESDIVYLNLQLHSVLAVRSWGHVVWVNETAHVRHLVSSEEIFDLFSLFPIHSVA